MSHPLSWLLIQGILPLLGAAILYTAMGICSFIVRNGKDSFAFQWTQALDPLGWLYGGSIIAIQSGIKGLSLTDAGILPQSCFAVSVFCLLMLITAMTERGRTPTWAPPIRLKLFASALVVIILWAGYETQVLLEGVAS
ncbi:MAG: hypothetical protein PW845_18300 [Pseudomonas sp.]|nr:hypothetical protein [Pseudomonas sp.]